MAITFVTGHSAYVGITPDGIANGDLMLVWGLGDDTPAGWSVRGSHSPAGLPYTLWFRVANNEPPDYPFGSGSMHWGYSIAVFRGVNTADPFATSADSFTTGSGTFSVPGVTTMAPNSLLIGCNHDARMTTMGIVFEDNFSLYSELITSVGATGARSSSSYLGSIPHAYLTALRPAGDSPPPPTAKPWTRAFIVE